MTPIRITPQVPVCISRERELISAPLTNESFVAEGVVYVRPEDKDSYYAVKVNGFRDAPGGIVESQRLTPGYNTDDLTLTTPNDPELSGELGLSEVIIDGVRYEAVDPANS